MSGKLKDGTTIDSIPPYERHSKAYCEGRKAKIDGELISANPHPSGSEANTAWAAGFNQYNVAGAVQDRDCCADLPKV